MRMDPPPDKFGGGGDAGDEFHFKSLHKKPLSRSSNPHPHPPEQVAKKKPHSQPKPSRPPLRGAGSYPSMIRARTANRNKIAKRNSESSVALTGALGTKARPAVGGSASDIKKRQHQRPLHKKKSVYSRATRRKSLENLGLVVRNRCGTAKLQWPSEKKDTDLFDLLPEGCLQVRQLRMSTPKGKEPFENFYSNLGKSSSSSGPVGKSKSTLNLTSRDDLSIHDIPSQIGYHHREESSSSSGGGISHKTDWKNKRNISVIVRIRPKLSRELMEKSIVFRTDGRTIVFDPKEKGEDFYFQGVKQPTRNDFGRKRPNRNAYFHYDKVYGPESTNRHIFMETLEDLTDHLIEGFNSTVFAYGATGSGKTYTMIGSNSNPGLIVLMVETLYKRIDELVQEYECDVACSYLEVYNESIKDLLNPDKELYIREDGKKGIIIPELTFYKPKGPVELLKLLKNGNRMRTQHATDLNAESSRSHAVFEVKLCLKKKNRAMKNEHSGGGGDGEQDENNHSLSSEEDGGLNKVRVIHSKLVMVDLAGSERGTAATPPSGIVGGFMMDTGARQREGSSINKSLLALANCISALADGKCHIPFRNSKLTRLLKDALSGNCTTVMIANISPSTMQSEDTYNTLKYADRAKNIVGPGTKHRNVFLEDLLMEDSSKLQMAELQAKVIQLSEMLAEEKMKNQRQKHENSSDYREEHQQESRKPSGLMNLSLFGGGDAAEGIHNIIQTAMGLGLKECHPEKESGSGNSNSVTEDQLPMEIQKYLHLIKERARVYSNYVQFASESRLEEWKASSKKLKADMADFLGRLPVSDENYVSFCALKNEVNNMAMMASRASSAINLDVKNSLPPTSPPPPHVQHKKYAMKLKHLTEKLELVRLNCVAKNLLSLPGGGFMGDSLSPQLEAPSVNISLEEFLQFKRLLGEQEGNDKMEEFYHRFSQQINDQLITSGMTLMHSLKLFKKMESLLKISSQMGGGGDAPHHHHQDILFNIQSEFKELSDFIYGSGGSSELNSILDGNNNPLQIPGGYGGRPQTTSNLGRRSNLILEDLHKLKKAVEQPLLIQLTSLVEDGDEEFGDDDDDGDEIESNLVEEDKPLNENSSHGLQPRSQFNVTYRRKSLSGSARQPPPPPPTTTIMTGLGQNRNINNEEGDDDYEEDFQTDYHHHPFDDSAAGLPVAQAEGEEVTADESSSKETILRSDPELYYGGNRQEVGLIQRSPSLLTVKQQQQPSRRKRRTWNTSTTVTYENEGRMMMKMEQHQAPPPPPPTHATSGIGTPSHIPVPRKSSQQNSDYEWCTTSTGTTTESSTTTTATTSSSASASLENVLKANAKKPGQRKPSVGAGNKKRLVGQQQRPQHQPVIKEEQPEQIGLMGQLGKNLVKEEAQEKSANPKYTYRLESPSQIMQGFSAQDFTPEKSAIARDDDDDGGESSNEDDEDDDDDEDGNEEEDDSSDEVSVASTLLKTSKSRSTDSIKRSLLSSNNFSNTKRGNKR